MKKIFYRRGDKMLWSPWGFGGCLGRLLLFLLLLSLLLVLLSLFRHCDNRQHRGDISRDEDTTVVSPNPNEPIARENDPDWNRPIDGGENVGLPSPGDNRLPPFQDMDPVPNPDNDGATRIFPNLLYVILDSESNDETIKTFASKFTSLYPPPQHKILEYNTSSKTLVLYVPAEKRQQICRALPNQISEIDFYVVPVEVMTQSSSYTPSDPEFKNRRNAWYLEPIQAKEAWAITMGSPEVIVGIVDSYMDLNHPELAGNRCIYPYNAVDGSSNVMPKRGANRGVYNHGTMVTSIAVGNANNNSGLCGIAPKCKFIPVSIGDDMNTITMVEGLLYCMYHGADVINLSLGTLFADEVYRQSLDEQIEFSKRYALETEKMWAYVFKLANKHNTTIVWAAGNEHSYGLMDETKRNPNTIKVAAVDTLLKRADFSNFANFPNRNLFGSTISAPGVRIWNAVPNKKYEASDGTSFSAPIITGVVALMKSKNKNLTTQQIIQILHKTGKPLPNYPEIGRLVQIKNALVEVNKINARQRQQH